MSDIYENEAIKTVRITDAMKALCQDAHEMSREKGFAGPTKGKPHALLLTL